MTRLRVGLHPGFDELSAHADRSDTQAARTRVGRHVARCAVCTDAVNEIRTLGEAARTSVLPSAPAGLWARIEHRMDDAQPAGAGASTEHALPIASAREGDADSAPVRPRRASAAVVRGTMLGVLAAVVASLAVVALDSREPLAAATPRRLQVDREFARPGGVITLRYRPIPLLAAQTTLTVWMYTPGRGDQTYDMELTRAGTLRRRSALEFTGTVVMPDSSPMATFVVGDSVGEIMDRSEFRTGRLPITVLAADEQGRPRLDALVTALGTARSSTERATLTRWAARMRELYPSAPETWLLGDVYAPRTVVSDIVKLFESRERRYYGWHDRLEHRTGLSEQTELMMASLGWELMDTARAEFWATRLMHDHPASPWAPTLWIRKYRDVPGDSAAAVLDEFEPIYMNARPVGAAVTRGALSQAMSLAERSGDSTLIRRWSLRRDPGEMSSLLGTELTRFAGDHVVLDGLRRRLQDALLREAREEHGAPTLWGRSRVFAWYERQRIRTRLAAIQLLEGEVRSAKDSLDVLVAESMAQPACPFPETIRWRAEASRRLGLMEQARTDLAYVVVTGDWRVQVLSDSASTLLGTSYSKASWDGALADANARKQKCWDDSRDARRRAGG